LYEAESWRKRRLRQLHNLTRKVRFDLELRKISQTQLLPGNDPLLTEGVIYAVVHIPSGATYVGQTINSAFTRFKQHWHQRHSASDFRHRYLYRRMCGQPVFNFIVWPLEKIDPALYITEGNRRDKHLFRRAASCREGFWVRALKTLHPIGLNAVLPGQSLGQTRRGHRTNRWHEYITNQPQPDTQPRSYITVQDDTVTIDTTNGPHHKTRLQLADLLNQASQGQWESIESYIRQARSAQRSRLLRWLHEHVNNNQLCTIIETLEQIIRRHQYTRTRYSSRRQQELQHFIKIVHAHECLRASKLRTILHKPEIVGLHPSPEVATSIRICDKLVPPLRTQFCNFTTTALKVTSSISLAHPDTCPCLKTFPNCKNRVDGHVVTVDYNCIPDTNLRNLFWQGSKYRLNFEESDALLAITIGLDEYVHKACKLISKTRGMDPNQITQYRANLSEWRDAVLQECSSNLRTHNHHLQSNVPQDTRQALKRLQHDFVICPVDKTSHNLAICCKNWYLHKLSSELDSPSYAPSQESPAEIVRRHAEWNEQWDYKHYNILPYLYYVLKAHKSPPTGRGIAGTTQLNFVDTQVDQASNHNNNTRNTSHDTNPSSNNIDSNPPPVAANDDMISDPTGNNPLTTTTPLPTTNSGNINHGQTDTAPGTSHTQNNPTHHPLSAQNGDPLLSRVGRIHSRPRTKPCCSTTSTSRALSYALQGVISTLRKKDNELYINSGLRRCWIVQSAEEVIMELKADPTLFQNLTPHTADFTSMYTKLPQDRILRNVERAIKEAHEHELSVMDQPPAQLYMVTTGKHRGQWVTRKVQGSLSVEDMVKHVHFIVHNTYFMAEDGTLRHQKFGIPMGTNAGPEIANLCLYADEADFIDNLVNSGNIREAQLHAHTSRFIDDVLSWNTLPPPSSCYGLEWRETTNDDGSCTFLGCKIEKRSNGMIRLSVFDKAAEWNFHVIRYPSAKSNIPTHQPAGIFTGQVTRFWQICNNTHDFKHAVTQLTLRLLLRGHYASTLAMGWNKYVQAQHTRTTPLTTKLKHWFKRMVKWALHHPLPDPNSQPGTQTNHVETSQPPQPQPQPHHNHHNHHHNHHKKNHHHNHTPPQPPPQPHHHPPPPPQPRTTTHNHNHVATIHPSDNVNLNNP
jgi:hypothetical protein